jgi:aspartate aminotransferase
MALELTGRLGPPQDPAPVNVMARGLAGSSILKIAGEIRALEAKGERPCNLTVGDFKPREFPIPAALSAAVAAALSEGQTNYPPSDGLPELRREVQRLYATRLGLGYPLESVVVASGARPILYATYRAVVEAGETVVFPVPSWNNDHYCHLMGARPVAVPTEAKDGFMPSADRLAPHLREARLLVLCSPLNPTGTMVSETGLREIASAIVEENRRRAGAGERPLVLLFDQIYWMLSAKGVRHVTPVELAPELAPHTVFVDGISKSFAATGLRVGWGVGAPALISRMRDVLGHVGAWAPKPEQAATARFLADDAAVASFVEDMNERVGERLGLLYDGLSAMRAKGLPVEAIPPQGAIYLSVRFDLVGRAGLASNEAIRRLLLERAGFAVVPFQAFGLPDESGWFRLSVGAVSPEEIRAVLPKVEAALAEVVG